jgi:hypothetical protein
MRCESPGLSAYSERALLYCLAVPSPVALGPRANLEHSGAIVVAVSLVQYLGV